MRRDQFDDQLSRLLAVDVSTDFNARVRSALTREPRRSRVPGRLITVAAMSIAVTFIIALSLPLRELPIEESTRPVEFSGTDKHLPPEPAEPAPRPIQRNVLRRHAPVRATAPESIPQVLISEEDRQAFQRLVRYVNEQELVMSVEEATSQRVSNELALEEGAVQ